MRNSKEGRMDKGYWNHSGRWKGICHWVDGKIKSIFAKGNSREGSRENVIVFIRGVEGELILWRFKK